jgi:hypothetical protein
VWPHTVPAICSFKQTAKRDAKECKEHGHSRSVHDEGHVPEISIFPTQDKKGLKHDQTFFFTLVSEFQ